MSPIAQYASQFVGALGPSRLPWWFVFVVGAAIGAAGGANLVALTKNAELATLRRDYAEATAKAERDARTALQAAQARGDELTTQLEGANRAAALIQETLDEQIRKATTGRPCLDGAALRLLDRAPGIAPAGVPKAAGQPDAAHGENAGADTPRAGADSDEPAATDTQVALWARAAAGQYAECVRRYDALIDWHQPNNTPP